MKIIIDKSDNVVLYAGDGLILTSDGLIGTGFIDPRVTPSTADIVEVPSLPPGFTGGAYTYILGEWALTDYGNAHMAEILPARKRSRRNEVNALLVQKIQSGVPYTFPDTSTGVIQTRDDTDFRNVQGLSSAAMALIIAGQSTADMVIRTEDDVTHVVTAQQMTALGLAVMAHVQNLYSRSWAHKDEIEARTTVNDVLNYDITTGW